jgi:hypothetical protein
MGYAFDALRIVFAAGLFSWAIFVLVQVLRTGWARSDISRRRNPLLYWLSVFVQLAVVVLFLWTLIYVLRSSVAP